MMVVKEQELKDLEELKQKADEYIQANINPDVRSMLDSYHAGLGMPFGEIVETILLDYVARISVLEQLYGEARVVWLPFIIDKDGCRIRGNELLEYLIRRYTEEFAFEDHEINKQIELMKDRYKKRRKSESA